MPRITITRDFYIPENARKVSHRHSSAVAYVYTTGTGHLAAMVFHGKAQKPAWRYRFRNDVERADRITRFFEAAQEHEQRRADRQAERKARGRGLAVGDVLSAMWGYEQTNIDWYEVTGLIGKSMVEVRQLAEDREETNWQQGKTVPLPGHYIGEPMRRKASEGYVKIDDVRSASKVEPMAMIGGKPVFAAQHFTAYY